MILNYINNLKLKFDLKTKQLKFDQKKIELKLN